MQTIDFYFDFASPNCYLTNRVLRDIAAKHGARVCLQPVLLGGIFKSTDNKAPFVAFGGIKGKLDYEMLEMRRFIARHGFDQFQMNPHFPINTLAAMRGLIAAREMSISDAYVEAMETAMWEQGKNIGDVNVIAETLSASGLPTEDILVKAQSDGVKKALIDETAAAVERGIFGLPTMFIGDEMFFGKERLIQINDMLAG